MKKFIPYEKLSKKKKKELDALQRKTWGNVNPVTRKAKNNKAYDRAKNRNREDDTFDSDFFIFSKSVLTNSQN